MGIRGITRAHLLDSGREQTITMEDIRILSKETENQPRDEVVQIFPPLRLVPVWVILQQLNVETIEPTRSLA
jgi:hypothetical protein